MNTISLLSGFLVIFTGVYLLNLSRRDPNGHRLLTSGGDGSSSIIEDGVPTDGLATLQTRMSMQARRSSEAHRVSVNAAFGPSGDREGLMRSYDYDEENGALGLNHYYAADCAGAGPVISSSRSSSPQTANGVAKGGQDRNLKGHDR